MTRGANLVLYGVTYANCVSFAAQKDLFSLKSSDAHENGVRFATGGTNLVAYTCELCQLCY